MEHMSRGLLTITALATLAACTGRSSPPGLWGVYDSGLAGAKYVDLTQTLTPTSPVWHGFGPSVFGRTVNPETGAPYTYAQDGFEATRYVLSSDQFGTQLDPPAHWAPEYPSIDELPPTVSLRPLVVISIVPQVARDPGYHLAVADILSWERAHGAIPAGSVVMVRSDWSKAWPDPKLAEETVFPGVSLDALKFLHERRHILFHGHEPLDTDTTPTLEGESWLMHHGYMQAEGVAHLDEVAESGCLVTIGFPKLGGGLGGYARFVAICPATWPHGIKLGDVPDAPLAANARPLHWDAARGMRTRE